MGFGHEPTPPPKKNSKRLRCKALCNEVSLDFFNVKKKHLKKNNKGSLGCCFPKYTPANEVWGYIGFTRSGCLSVDATLPPPL